MTHMLDTCFVQKQIHLGLNRWQSSFLKKLSRIMIMCPEIRQSKINSRSVAGPMGQMNRRPSV